MNQDIKNNENKIEEVARKVKKTGNTFTTVMVSIILISSVLLAFYTIPLPFTYQGPGKFIPAAEIVEVEGGKDHSGQIIITSVVTEQANILLYINSLFNPNADITPLEQPVSQDSSALYQAQAGPDPYKIQLKESIYRAKVIALQQMGFELNVHPDGVQVVFVPENENRKYLQPGDIITEIMGIRVRTQKIFTRYIARAARQRTEFSIQYIRDGNNNKGYIYPEIIGNQVWPGVFLQNHMARVALPKTIFIKDFEFTGSSAGLPICLEIINQLQEEDITHGKKIAGTGHLNEDGTLEPVEGVKYKVLGAEKMGCDYLICSAENVKTAEKTAKEMKIIGVSSVSDALEKLNSLKL
ncbi:MAG: S16 family serine protease [Vulcanimicrobiota bacterium]